MASVAGLVGCGDDDVVPGGTDSGPVGIDSGPGGTDAGPGGMDSGGGPVDAGPTPTDSGGGGGACTNPSDMAAIQRSYSDGGVVDPDGGMGSSVSTIAGQCGVTCLGAADCTSNCIQMRTSMMVSDGCADCYGASGECAAMNCIAVCIGGASAPACVACRCGDNPAMENCFDVFTACSGIPSSACATVDAGM